MEHEAEDQSVLKSIRQLADEEHRLYAHETLTDAARARLAKIISNSISAGICCGSVKLCEMRDATQTRRMCGHPRSSKATSNDLMNLEVTGDLMGDRPGLCPIWR